MKNAIHVIAPYWLESAGTWVFDDERVELVEEPFVSGVPEMIDALVKDIPNARKGFRLLFSERPFPGYQRELVWVKEEFFGNWYRFSDCDMMGWLCPALFLYYESAPVSLYVKAEAMRR